MAQVSATGLSKGSTFVAAVLSGALYKRNAARLVRSLTLAAFASLAVIGAWVMHQTVFGDFNDDTATGAAMMYGIPALVAITGVWVSYRLVHYPPFADFLIDVEMELAKVNWPARGEVYRATVVVITVMFLLSMVLFAYDVIWQQLLRAIQVLQF